MLWDKDFTMIPNEILADEDLTPAEKLVYFALLMRARGKKYWAWPSQETIAKDLSLSRRTVNSTVQTLVKRGLVIKRTNPNGRTILYEIRTPEEARTETMCANFAQQPE